MKTYHMTMVKNSAS